MVRTVLLHSLSINRLGIKQYFIKRRRDKDNLSDWHVRLSEPYWYDNRHLWRWYSMSRLSLLWICSHNGSFWKHSGFAMAGYPTSGWQSGLSLPRKYPSDCRRPKKRCGIQVHKAHHSRYSHELPSAGVRSADDSTTGSLLRSSGKHGHYPLLPSSS